MKLRQDLPQGGEPERQAAPHEKERRRAAYRLGEPQDDGSNKRIGTRALAHVSAVHCERPSGELRVSVLHEGGKLPGELPFSAEPPQDEVITVKSLGEPGRLRAGQGPQREARGHLIPALLFRYAYPDRAALLQDRPAYAASGEEGCRLRERRLQRIRDEEAEEAPRRLPRGADLKQRISREVPGIKALPVIYVKPAPSEEERRGIREDLRQPDNQRALIRAVRAFQGVCRLLLPVRKERDPVIAEELLQIRAYSAFSELLKALRIQMQHGAYKAALPAAVLRECQRDRIDVTELAGDAHADKMPLRIKGCLPGPALAQDGPCPGLTLAVRADAGAAEPHPDPRRAARLVRRPAPGAIRRPEIMEAIVIVTLIIPAAVIPAAIIPPG